ncbi:MAG TPA: sensor histidine kinase [Spirochaetales bacterium]|nr:sensor histidine kinase [Spirochaetales bacterium]
MSQQMLLIAMTLEFAVFALMLGLLASQLRGKVRGPLEWACHALLSFAASATYILLGGRYSIPLLFLANALLYAGILAIPIGLAYYLGERPRWGWCVFGWALGLAIFFWFMVLQPNTAARVWAYSLFGASVFMFSAGYILKRAPDDMAVPTRIAAAFYAIYSLLNLGRIVVFILRSRQVPVFGRLVGDEVFFVGALFIYPGMVFAELQLVSARLVLDLAKAVDEKALMAREMNHRIKNSLALAESLVELQRGEGDDTAFGEALASIRSRLHSISLVHARLYHEGADGSIRADEYLGALAADLCYNLGYTDLRTNLEPLSVDAAVAVPLGVITNELITNAIKYGNAPGSRRLELSLSERGGAEAILRVADGGPGFSENDKPGLGTTLVDSLAAQLDGSVRRFTEGGAVVEVTIPLPGRRSSR